MDKTLQWLYAAECDGGGISAWRTPEGVWHKPYPEITGYVIPTLVNWGAGDLATRCADWLLTQQNSDGSWNGLDGVPRPFDTAAIIEGLISIFHATNNPRYLVSGSRAHAWMQSQITDEGYLKNSPRNPQSETYNLRASAIIQNQRELEYRNRVGFPASERSHYMAYALEGVLNFNDVVFAGPKLKAAHQAQKGLFPFWVDQRWDGTSDDLDICASAQMGILFERVGLDANSTYRAIEQRIEPNGGVPQSTRDSRQIAWGAKFWLDFKRMMNQ